MIAPRMIYSTIIVVYGHNVYHITAFDADGEQVADFDYDGEYVLSAIKEMLSQMSGLEFAPTWQNFVIDPDHYAQTIGD